MVKTSGTSPSGGARASLRERTRAAMRAEVAEIAFRLFTEQGFDQTTVEQIAAEAGLSRTTFFRYFGTKEEVVLGKMAEVGREVAAALAARPEGERPWDSLRRALDVVTRTDPGDPDRSRHLMRLLNDACVLMTRQWEKTEGWQSMLVPEISRRLGGATPGNELRAWALAASAIACLNAALDAWTAGDGEVPLGALLDQAMSALSELAG